MDTRPYRPTIDADLVDELLERLETLRLRSPESSLDALINSDARISGECARWPGLADQLARNLLALEAVSRTFSADHNEAYTQPQVPGFEILSYLGGGGAGDVYRAVQLSLGREVSIKVIKAGRFAGHQARQRFRVEAELASRLRHPGIVQVHEMGEVDGVPFLVQEFVEGGSLSDWAAGRPVAAREAARLVSALSDATAYAHQCRILHRDLKPSNVLLSATGEPKIADFGLAKLLDDKDSALTRSGEALGTLSYMSPEQVTGRGIGEATDIYGLGAILYELLTGRPPFVGTTPAETISQLQTRDPAAPRLFVPGVPADLEAVALKCLEKDPHRRYASAREMCIDLERFLAGEPTAARPIGGLVRSWRWSKRNRLLASMSATVLLLCVAVAGVSVVAALRLAHQAERERIANRESQQAQEASERATRIAIRESEEKDKQRARADEEARRARQEATTSRRLSDLMSSIFQGADPTGLGGLGVRHDTDFGKELDGRELMKRAIDHLNSNALADESPLVLARLKARLSITCRLTGMLEDAGALANSALAIIETNANIASPADCAITYHAVGVIRSEEEHFVDAENYLRRALAAGAIALKEGLFSELDEANIEFDLAWLLADAQARTVAKGVQDFVEAEERFRHVLSVRRKHLGDHSPDVGVAATALGVLLMTAAGQRSMSQTEVAELLQIFQLQPQRERFGQALQFAIAGMVARQNHKLDLAIAQHRKALDLIAGGDLGDKEDSFPDHPALILLLCELAGTLKQNGQFADGEAAISRALEICRRILPFGHPRMIPPLLEFASSLADRKDYSEAEARGRQALEIAKRYRRRTPSVMYGPSEWLIAHLSSRGEYEKLNAAWEEFLVIAKDMHGDDPSASAAYLQVLTKSLARVTNAPMLVKMAYDCATLAEHMCMDDASRLITIRSDLIKALCAAHCLDQATEQLARLRALLIPMDHAAWPTVPSDVFLKLADVELGCTRTWNAQQYAEALFDERRMATEATKASAGRILAQIAIMRGDLQKAMDEYQRAIQWLENAQGFPALEAAALHVEYAEVLLGRINEEAVTQFSIAEQILKKVIGTTRNRSHVQYAVVADIDLSAYVALLGLIGPELAVEAQSRTSKARESRISALRSHGAAETVEVIGDIAKTMHGHFADNRSQLFCELSAEAKQLWDRMVGEQVVELLTEGLRLSDERGTSFPTWQIRQDLEIELGRYLMRLDRHDEAESHLNAVLERTNRALGPRHYVVMDVQDNLDRLRATSLQAVPK